MKENLMISTEEKNQTSKKGNILRIIVGKKKIKWQIKRQR